MNLSTPWVRWHLREAFRVNTMGKMAVNVLKICTCFTLLIFHLKTNYNRDRATCCLRLIVKFRCNWEVVGSGDNAIEHNSGDSCNQQSLVND